ncbi:MAG TPA: hypothetical protein VG816_02110 [Solirubrobacterales bacterium]|nr:hypothetical protein [Solirubrobacterales bacterium]
MASSAHNQGEQKAAEVPQANGPEAPKRWSVKQRCLRIAARTLIAAGSLAPLVYSIFTDWPLGSIVEKLVGVVALGLLAFHVVNTKTRFLLEHWRHKPLRSKLYREIFLGWVVPIGIALAAFLLPPTWPVLLAIGVVFGITWLLYEALQKKIRKMVSDAGLQQGSERFKQRQPFKVSLDIEDTIDQIAAEDHVGPLKLFEILAGPPLLPGLSRTRTIILCTMAICLVLAFTAAAQVFLKEAIKAPAAITKTRGGKQRTPKAKGGHGGAPRQVETPVVGDDETCRFPPARGAPRWARSDLNALYYGGKLLNANPPPGNIGGCTEKAVTITTPQGDFVYTIGHNLEGEVRSVAVVSSEYGPAIFLAPAAKYVIGLIVHGVAPLGGYPTMEAAGGDMAAITTPQGTFILIRAALHLPGMPEFAAPYIKLVPTVGAAWLEAMRESDAWLWPRALAGSAGREFVLTTDPNGNTSTYVVSYDPVSGTARREGYQYELPEPQLAQAELEHYAALAR